MRRRERRIGKKMEIKKYKNEKKNEEEGVEEDVEKRTT